MVCFSRPPKSASCNAGMSRRPACVQHGFTVIELLVVIGMVGLLVALLMPAVQAAREAGRSMQCRNNLRQVGLAIHSYSETHACLPMGRVPMYDPRFAGPNPPCTAKLVDKSFLVAILPQIEQSALYNALNHAVSVFAIENTTIHSQAVEIYLCPSDPGAGQTLMNPGAIDPMAPDPPGGRWVMTRTSYSASFGTFPVLAMPAYATNCNVPTKLLAQSDGCFNDVRPIPLSAVADGLSGTIFASEKALSAFDELRGLLPDLPADRGWFVSGNLGDTLFTTMFPPNAYKRTALGAFTSRVNSASSLHRGGVNVLMGDGSVRFIDENIDSWPVDPLNGEPLGAIKHAGGWWDRVPSFGVWQALGTRAGSESNDKSF